MIHEEKWNEIRVFFSQLLTEAQQQGEKWLTIAGDVNNLVKAELKNAKKWVRFMNLFSAFLDCLLNSPQKREKSNKGESFSISKDFLDLQKIFSLRKCTTILLLGETGVGKSTFINGLANYLKYKDFDKARDRGVEVLISSRFTYVDVDVSRCIESYKMYLSTTELKFHANPKFELTRRMRT